MNNDLYKINYETDVDLPATAIEKIESRTHGKTSFQSALSRRRFLKLSGLAGGGLALAFMVGNNPLQAETAIDEKSETAKNSTSTFTPNAYVQIKPDGTIIIAAQNPEVGQGVKTTLPMMVAEELEVPWASVTVVQSDISREKYGRQAAGGSRSVPSTWDPLRQAGALARTMLVSAAAQIWLVPVKECKAADGAVHHNASGRSLPYGELVATAVKLDVPAADTVQLKARSEYKILGTFVGGVDNMELVTGKPLFTMDQKLPGLRYAVYSKCPRFLGKVKSANLDAVKQQPGVIDAFIVEGHGNSTQLQPGVAIVAKSTYEALQAQKSLDVRWDYSEASNDNWSDISERAAKLTSEACEEKENSGNFDSALEAASQVVEAFYTYPYLPHAPMEPQNCTAWFRDGGIEFWAPTQNPQNIAGSVADILKISTEKVKINQIRIGGGFGRRLDNDYACEVAAIAGRVDGPVNLVYSREQDTTHDYYRVGGFHRLTGTLNQENQWTGLRDRTALFSNLDAPDQTARGGAVRASSIQCPEIPNLRIEAATIDAKIPTGWWRAPGSCSLAWVYQSFIHEMATAAGRDHVEFLLEQLGEPRWLGNQRANELNTERAINVIKDVAEKADWGTSLPKNRGRGLAFYFSHLGYIAEVAEVTISGEKQVKVDRVVVATDVGLLLNKSGGENQVEGSIIDALSTMADLEVTFENGAIREQNFDRYPLLRMPAQPAIEINWITTDHSPTGLGEPAFPPLAAAVTNAIYDATGQRIRSMPISKEGFTVI